MQVFKNKTLNVELQASPKRQGVWRLVVNDKATHALVYQGDDIKQIAFAITSSTPICEENAIEVANAIFEKI